MAFSAPGAGGGNRDRLMAGAVLTGALALAAGVYYWAESASKTGMWMKPSAASCPISRKQLVGMLSELKDKLEPQY
ncbi:unnamed protein product, partial [Symbiodinium sp. KB8]